MGIDVGLLSLLLQDLSKLVFANAAKERSHFVGLLDHPLHTETTALSDDSLRPASISHYIITPRVLMWWQSKSLDMTDLSNLYWVLCCSSSVILNFELLHNLLKPRNRDEHAINLFMFPKEDLVTAHKVCPLLQIWDLESLSVESWICSGQVQSLKPHKTPTFHFGSVLNMKQLSTDQTVCVAPEAQPDP